MGEGDGAALPCRVVLKTKMPTALPEQHSWRKPMRSQNPSTLRRSRAWRSAMASRCASDAALGMGFIDAPGSCAVAASSLTKRPLGSSGNTGIMVGTTRAAKASERVAACLGSHEHGCKGSGTSATWYGCPYCHCARDAALSLAGCKGTIACESRRV